MDDAANGDSPPARFPTADVLPASLWGRIAERNASRMWIVTVLCALGAGWLVWMETSTPGPRLTILFRAGHGLEPGDAVRFRGIDVGEVRAVVLGDDLASIQVELELHAEAANLAREGALFWIERPDLSIGRARGLDTLVSGRYVGVAPGPADASPDRSFTGLDQPPSSVLGMFEGLEIVLESQQRFGLQRGSPVSYRGVEIGHIMSVGLANDSVSVVAQTYIEPEYRTLVRENTRFWSNSGIDFRLGFSGLEFDADTLATIAAGGVAIATPDEPGRPVAAGHRFDLAKSPESDWLAWTPRLAIGSASLDESILLPQPALAIVRRNSSLAWLTSTPRRGRLLSLPHDRLLGPADLLVPTADEEPILEAWGKEVPLTPNASKAWGKLALRQMPAGFAPAEHEWPHERIRIAEDPEDIVLTCGSDILTMPLAAARLATTENGWNVDSAAPLSDAWHGASVIAARDGKLLGVLLYREGRGSIAGFNAKLRAAIAEPPLP